MENSSRLLAVVTEFATLPVDIKDRTCREIFDRISEGHKVNSFQAFEGGAEMHGRREKPNVVKYIIRKGSIALVYEFCENTLNYYQGLISDFLDSYTGVTGAPLLLAQNVVIRRLFNLDGRPDAREYLLRSVHKLGDDRLAKFGRPMHLFGTRMFFPQTDNNAPGFDVKIESWLEDYRTLYVENKGMFARQFDAKKDNVEIGKNVALTDNFISENIMGFIDQFRDGV